jgi:hypothetical protein
MVDDLIAGAYALGLIVVWRSLSPWP